MAAGKGRAAGGEIKVRSLTPPLLCSLLQGPYQARKMEKRERERDCHTLSTYCAPAHDPASPGGRHPCGVGGAVQRSGWGRAEAGPLSGRLAQGPAGWVVIGFLAFNIQCYVDSFFLEVELRYNIM